MKKLMLAVLMVSGIAAAAYAADCCLSSASCCPGPCCETAQ